MARNFKYYEDLIYLFLEKKVFRRNFITLKTVGENKYRRLVFNPTGTQQFEVRITQVNKIPKGNNKLTTNEIKNKLLLMIVDKLKYKVISSGKIYILIKGYGMKIELI